VGDCGLSVLFVAACGGGPARTPEATAVQTAAVATSEPTVTSTAEPVKGDAGKALCVYSTQGQTDATPTIVSYSGGTEKDCLETLGPKPNWTAWEIAHPPVRLKAEPTEGPLCVETIKGLTVKVWGTTTTAGFLCALLKGQAD
jgi:hypothetical protein